MSEDLITKLKGKYDAKNIVEIEAECTGHIDKYAKNRMNFILTLYYLDRTNRYKDNPIYKNSTFESYIKSKFNLRYSTYDKERFAFISCPEATAKWGAGLIGKIKDKCGAGNVIEVINKIEAIKNPTHERIDTVISQFAKKQKPNKVKMSARDYEHENARQGKTIAEYIQIIKEKDEQVERLKLTVASLRAENEDLKRQLRTKKDFGMPFVNPINQPIFDWAQI